MAEKKRLLLSKDHLRGLGEVALRKVAGGTWYGTWYYTCQAQPGGTQTCIPWPCPTPPDGTVSTYRGGSTCPSTYCSTCPPTCGNNSTCNWSCTPDTCNTCSYTMCGWC